MILVLNSISHFLVDGVCLATLFGAAKSGADIAIAILVYNTLAFSTQVFTGWWVDKPDLARKLEPLSMLLVAAGYFLPAGLMVRVVLIGLGNSLFHVCGGCVTLRQSAGRAAPLGVFVAPGALGVALGKLWPQFGALLSAGLIVFAALIFFAYRRDPAAADEVLPAAHFRGELPDYREKDYPLAAVALLTLAVAVRAIGGYAAVFSWNTGAWTAAAMAVFVFAGKTAGGFVCDRLGAVKSSALSILPAALLTAFLAFSMPASLLGQFLLNLSMPVTLWLLYKLMPDEPGFAFGLAASALWPGTLLGLMIQLTGAAQKALILVSFAAGLVAVIYAVSVLKKDGESE
jgi:FSR family fosmidomycin resistance protein-like MFS transporter